MIYALLSKNVAGSAVQKGIMNESESSLRFARIITYFF